MYAVTLDRIVVSFERFNNLQDFFRDFKFGQLNDVTQRVVGLNGKDT